MRKFLIHAFLLLLVYSPLNTNAFETKAKYAILVDYDTGAVLFEKNADELMKPSSMTKLMTVYLVFERLQKDIIKLEDKLTVSEKAWRKGGSKTFLKHTERVTIDTLLNGIVVQSGNDACITIAEGISYDEDSFAKLMTKTGNKIGLKNSNFKNATGWPDKDHYMTVRDIATLSRKLIKNFPEYYHYFVKTDYTHNGIKQKNRNILLKRDIGVDGLKTGHTEEAGYGIAVSAKQEDRRLIVVVNGLSSELARADEAEKLLNYGFRYFAEKTLFVAGQEITEAKTWQGAQDTVSLAVKDNIKLLVPKLSEDQIEIEVNYNEPFATPIKKGTELAVMKIKIPDMGERTFPLVAGEDADQASWFSRVVDNLVLYINSL